MAPIFKDPGKNWGREIVSYGPYKPWNVHVAEGGDRSNYPEHSGKVLDVKDGYGRGINHFSDLVEKDLGEGFAVSVVPSHDPGKQDAGIKTLVV